MISLMSIPYWTLNCSFTRSISSLLTPPLSIRSFMSLTDSLISSGLTSALGSIPANPSNPSIPSIPPMASIISAIGPPSISFMASGSFIIFMRLPIIFFWTSPSAFLSLISKSSWSMSIRSWVTDSVVMTPVAYVAYSCSSLLRERAPPYVTGLSSTPSTRNGSNNPAAWSIKSMTMLIASAVSFSCPLSFSPSVELARSIMSTIMQFTTVANCSAAS
mmetsp:Transcript_4734/g.13339  ORF Transcript_4734/g.13339 Transcript_4734/m.13339 type:complete len:218 (-) Transcript_4734:2347-3000(-)